MAGLLDRVEEAVSVTAMARGFSAKLREVSSRETERLLIFKDNQPAAVILNVQAYQEMLDELEDLRVEATARDRVARFDEGDALSHEAMRARFSQKDD